MNAAKKLPSALRWTARVVSTSILALVLLHIVSEGRPTLNNITLGEGLLWGGFVLSIVGFAVLWKWELTGGILALTGIAIFYAVEYALSGKLPSGWVFPAFFLPGLLSIASWLMEHQKNPI